jgi:hypothetical protein
MHAEHKCLTAVYTSFGKQGLYQHKSLKLTTRNHRENFRLMAAQPLAKMHSIKRSGRILSGKPRISHEFSTGSGSAQIRISRLNCYGMGFQVPYRMLVYPRIVSAGVNNFIGIMRGWEIFRAPASPVEQGGSCQLSCHWSCPQRLVHRISSHVHPR